MFRSAVAPPSRPHALSVPNTKTHQKRANKQRQRHHSLGAAELHVVAAVMGGMAAQEAIKLLTRQFVPFSGTLIYNAIASTTTVLDL